jgi:hypothetical protein
MVCTPVLVCFLQKKTRIDRIDPGIPLFYPLIMEPALIHEGVTRHSGRFSDFQIILLAAPSHFETFKKHPLSPNFGVRLKF